MNSSVFQGMHAVAVRRGASSLRSISAASASGPAMCVGVVTAVQKRAVSSLPTVAQSSFWRSLVPKPLRRQQDGTLPVANAVTKARKAKEWNPATFFIFIFLFIGSMSIQMIALKKDFDTFMRQSEVKLGLLKEVVERIQKGETVDVERALGTGDPTAEAEWAEALKEIERDETSRASKRHDKKAIEAAVVPSTAVASPQITAERPASSKVASATSFY